MNSKRGYSKIKVPMGDGEFKFLRYDANALAELEDILNIGSVLKLLVEFSEEVKGSDSTKVNIPEKLGFKTLRALVWAGIKGAGGSYTLEQIGDMMDPSRFADYMLATVRAITLATTGKETIPEPESEQDQRDPTEATAPVTTLPPRLGTGTA